MISFAGIAFGRRSLAGLGKFGLFCIISFERETTLSLIKSRHPVLRIIMAQIAKSARDQIKSVAAVAPNNTEAQ